MANSQSVEVNTTVDNLALQIITNDVDAENKFITSTIYLCIKNGEPVIIGSGRYASVALAAKSTSFDSATDFYALKFLKFDPESDVFSQIARIRFYEEIIKTKKFGLATRAHFVGYKGFSRVALPKKVLAWQRPGELAFITEIDEISLKNIEAFNTEQIEKKTSSQILKSKNFFSALQGDFFVMNVEQGTLDDILRFQHSWENHPLYSISKGYKAQLDTFRQEKKTRLLSFLEDTEIINDFHDKDFSGLSIIQKIGNRNNKLKNRIIVGLFTNIVQAVKSIHSHKDTDGYLAHRDIKPGNFLIGLNLPALGYSIKISDLGFISGVESIKDGKETMASSTKEPGALAPGSYKFRAPEQIDSGYEIHFKIMEEKNDHLIFQDSKDIRVEPGDWLECNGC